MPRTAQLQRVIFLGEPHPPRCKPRSTLACTAFVPPCLQTLPDALPAPVTCTALPRGLCWQQRERRCQGETQGTNLLPSLWFCYLTAALSSWDMWGEGAEQDRGLTRKGPGSLSLGRRCQLGSQIHYFKGFSLSGDNS